MNPLTPIIQFLYHTPHLEEVSKDDLIKQTEKYPYFSVGQLLLLKKMQSKENEPLKEQTAKTLLHFNNPMWLYWLMHQKENETIAIPDTTLSPSETNDLPFIKSINNEAEIVNTALVEQALSSTESTNDSLLEETPIAALKGISAEDIEILSGKKKSDNFVQQADEILAFEPFHTIDYFASQGIKLSSTLVPNDKLGRQLKSFTEWLKTMQKLPLLPEKDTLDDKDSLQIDAMAQDSLKGKDIVTESMADVLARQGMTEKAKEIYTKLSLLNPAKSHYFASKIEDLNKL